MLNDGGVQVGRTSDLLPTWHTWRWANEHHHQPARGRKLVEHQVDCLGIGDMVDPDPAALDATMLKIGAGNKE